MDNDDIMPNLPIVRAIKVLADAGLLEPDVTAEFQRGRRDAQAGRFDAITPLTQGYALGHNSVRA